MRRMYSKPQLLEAVESESKLNGIKVFEDIKDKDGHPRFIEGDIKVINEVSGITYPYAKWSLSGSHLLVVVVISIANGTTNNTGYNLKVDLPKWIVNKIIPFGESNYIDNKSINMWDSLFTSTQTLATQFSKRGGDSIEIYTGAITANGDRMGRLTYDLLIDNE